MNALASNELRPQGHKVSVVVGYKPVKHHFEGLVAAMKDADLLIPFSCRRFLPKEQMGGICAHVVEVKTAV
jgi:hypothetical protein